MASTPEHPVPIDRFDDDRLADYAGLRHRRNEWAESFIVESALAVERLVASPFTIRSVLVALDRLPRLQAVLRGVRAPVYVIDPALLNHLVGFNLHRGVLASADRRPGPSLDQVLLSARRLVVLEGSNDHENIGAIARSARGLGMDALVLDPTCADPFARRSVRVSMGEILHLPVVRCSEWPSALTAIGDAGFETWALTPDRSGEALGSVNVPDRVAVLAGAEGPGLSAGAMEAATRRIRIPLHAGVDSLNLGHALAITMAAVAPTA